jgi:hypothetical protein
MRLDERLERLLRLANGEATEEDLEWSKHQGFTEDEILEKAIAIEETDPCLCRRNGESREDCPWKCPASERWPDHAGGVVA